MKRALPVSIWLALAGGLLAQADWPPEVEELFRRGVEAQKAARLDEAERFFKDVLAGGGNAAFVHNNLGLVYQSKGEHQRALSEFGQAVALDRNYAAPHTLSGASLLALGRIDEAVRELETAVRLDPREPQARLLLGKAWQRRLRPDRAVEQYRELRRLAPSEPEYAYQLGRAYAALASWCLRRVQEEAPDSARAYQIRGERHFLAGRFEAAIDALKKAVRADPRLPGLHLLLARAYTVQGRRAEALAEVRAELAVVPESALAMQLERQLER